MEDTMMESTWDVIVKILAAVCGAIAGAFGGWDALLILMLGCMVVDYISGMVVAWMGKSLKTKCGGLSSKVGARGILKKGLMMMVVLIAVLLDNAIGAKTNMFRDMTCWFFVANETISIIENLNLAGVPFPTKLKALLGAREERKYEKMENERKEEPKE